jgi:hypothetical protein
MPDQSPDSVCPLGLELLEPHQRHVDVLGPVDGFDRGQDRLAIFPRDKRQAVPDQVHNAGLHYRLWEYRGDRPGKARETGVDRDQDVVDAAAFSSLITLSQNLAPSACSIQSPSTLFSPSELSASATYTAFFLIRCQRRSESPLKPSETEKKLLPIQARVRRAKSLCVAKTRLLLPLVP